MRAAQKEKLSLREEILRIRAEREQVALRMDAIRIRHEADSKEALVWFDFDFILSTSLHSVLTCSAPHLALLGNARY